MRPSIWFSAVGEDRVRTPLVLLLFAKMSRGDFKNYLDQNVPFPRSFQKKVSFPQQPLSHWAIEMHYKRATRSNAPDRYPYTSMAPNNSKRHARTSSTGLAKSRNCNSSWLYSDASSEHHGSCRLSPDSSKNAANPSSVTPRDSILMHLRMWRQRKGHCKDDGSGASRELRLFLGIVWVLPSFEIRELWYSEAFVLQRQDASKTREA